MKQSHRQRQTRHKKGHVLTDKKGIPLSVVITPANTHDIKAVTYVVDNAVVKQHQKHHQPTSPIDLVNLSPSATKFNGGGAVVVNVQSESLDT